MVVGRLLGSLALTVNLLVNLLGLALIKGHHLGADWALPNQRHNHSFEKQRIWRAKEEGKRRAMTAIHAHEFPDEVRLPVSGM